MAVYHEVVSIMDDNGNMVMERVEKETFVKNAAWKFLESFATKGISFLVTIVLARLLTPDDYGIIALTTVFISLAEIIVSSGFTTALIQKKEVEDVDYSVMLYLSLLIAFVLYVVVFFSAPLIADYYEEPVLTSVLRVLCLMFFFQAISVVRTAMITRRMRFDLLFKGNAVSGIISGALGIALAFLGFGVWALVYQQLSQQLLFNVILFKMLGWKPQVTFEFYRAKDYLRLSITTFGSSLISNVSDSLSSLVVGKVCSSEQLGYYSKGGQFPCQVSLYTFGAMSSVMLPTFSSYQDDFQALKRVFRKVFAMTAYVVMPLMAIMFVVSDTLIVFLFGSQWSDAAPIMQACCLYYAATPLMLACSQLFLSMNKGEIRIGTEFARLTLTVLLLVSLSAGYLDGVVEFAFWKAIIEVVTAVISIVCTLVLLKYRLWELLCDLGVPMLLSIVSAACSCAVGLVIMPGTLCMFVQAFVGGIVYAVLSFALKVESFHQIEEIIKSKVRRNG